MRTPARWLLALSLSLILREASAQDWQSYLLTDFAPPADMRSCASVADSLGHLHHYMVFYQIGGSTSDSPLYYMRTDFYGHILTDTIRLNGFAGGNAQPQNLQVTGDGEHSWCFFTDWMPDHQAYGLYFAGRDADGEEFVPARFLGRQGECAAAVYRAEDNVIHFLGWSEGVWLGPAYCQITSTGDTLVWMRPVDGLMPMGAQNCSLITSPLDGSLWASLVTIDGLGHGAFLVVRFGEDTSQTVHTALAGSQWGPAQNAFSMDARGHFDFYAGSDTVAGAWIRLDTTFQSIIDYQVLSPNEAGFAGVKTDSSGDSFLIYDRLPGLYWAFRRTNGEWDPPLSLINASLDGRDVSIVSMDSSRFAFTLMGAQSGGQNLLRLYTRGFPPYNAVPRARSVTEPTDRLSAAPNPFGSSLTVDISSNGAEALVLYDLLGRQVWSCTIEAGARKVEIHDPSLSALPSGTYFLKLKASSADSPLGDGVRISHVK